MTVEWSSDQSRYNGNGGRGKEKTPQKGVALMPNLAESLKQAMVRIARKEIRDQTGTTKRAATQHRRDIADLKRRIAALEKEVAFLRRQEKKRVGGKAPIELAEGARFSPRWVKVHRTKLGLSATDYAELVGVHAITIYNWEQGKTKPRKEQLASLVAIRRLGKREAMERLEMVR